GNMQFPSGVWTLGAGMANNSAAAAGILFDGGTMDFGNSGGTDTFTGPITIAAGVVYGPATLTFNGLLTFQNGAICTVYTSSACPAGTNAVVNINGGMFVNGNPSLQARTLSLPAGQTVTYVEGGTLTLYAGAIVNNSGTWDLSNDGSIFQSGNNDTFNNTGKLQKTSGTGNSYIDATFNNTGAVVVSGAALLMRGGSGCSTPCTGSWTVNTGGNMQFPSGVWTLGAGMANNSAAAAGILFDGGTMDFGNS